MKIQGAAVRPGPQQTLSSTSGLTFENSWSHAAPLPFHKAGNLLRLQQAKGRASIQT